MLHGEQRHNVLGRGGADENRRTAHAKPDGPDIELFVRRLVAHCGKTWGATEPPGWDRSGQQRAVEEIAPGKPMIVQNVPPNLKIYPPSSNRRRLGTPPTHSLPREWGGAWRKASVQSVGTQPLSP